MAPRVAKGRSASVDGLRAGAALSVLAYHVSFACGLTHSGAIAPLLAGLKGGVCVFFVISGWALYLPLTRALRDGRPPRGWGAYAEDRATRILPAYWLALAVHGLVVPHSGVFSSDAWRYALLGHIYRSDTLLGGLQVSWSLCVEVTFYAVLPVLVAVLARRGGPSRRPTAAQEGGLVVLLAAGSLALRYGLSGGLLASPSHGEALALTALPGMLDWFAAGMGLAMLSARLETGVPPPRGVAVLLRRPTIAFALAAGLYLVACGVQSGDVFLPLDGTVTHLLLGVAATLLVLGALAEAPERGGVVRTVLRHPACVWLGTVSYGIYLWHLTVLDLLLGDGAPPVHPTSAVTFLGALVAVLAGAVACGAMSWYLIERPLKCRLRAHRAGVRSRPGARLLRGAEGLDAATAAALTSRRAPMPSTFRPLGRQQD